MRLFKTPTEEIASDFLFWLETTIQNEAKSTKKTKSKYYKPSSLNCLRMMYFYRTLTTVEDTNRKASSVGVLHSGEDRHLRIQKAITSMKNNGFDCEWVDVEEYIKEQKITNLEVISRKEFETTVYNKELDMLFLCDGIVKIKGKYYLIEIKTENSISFYNRKTVADEHKHQATCYSISFNINNVIFIYENRDVCSKKVFLFTVKQELKDEVIGLIERCNKAVEDNCIPPRIECKSCNYCDYKKYCKAIDSGKIQPRVPNI